MIKYYAIYGIELENVAFRKSHPFFGRRRSFLNGIALQSGKTKTKTGIAAVFCGKRVSIVGREMIAENRF